MQAEKKKLGRKQCSALTAKWNVLGKQKITESETGFEKPRKEGWRA